MEILNPLFSFTKKLTLCAILLCAPSAAHADDDRFHKVEAAFLYNFFNYITWPGYAAPQELRQPRICIYQDDPITPYLNYVQNKMSSERTLDIRSISENDSMNDCNLLFLRHRLPNSTLQSIPSSTLIVTEPLDYLDRGEGMIELTRQGQGIQMSINQKILAENGFQVSSRLLALAMK